ncbi:MAG: hypothetical protein RLZ98_2078, partial [Pseudomonadota bacterium]
MRTWLKGLVAVACAMLPVPGVAQVGGDTQPVEVTNRSVPVLCAEKDNVSIAFNSPVVRSFRIEAIHPAYIATLVRDNYAPDWTDCDMSTDRVYKQADEHSRATIYESMDLWLVAHTFKTFWRPAKAVVTVGGKSYTGVHLLQLWVRQPNGGAEVLVFYPQDGYWRPRPLAPDDLDTTAFGSSFMIGPISDGPRPLVDIKEVGFDPATRTFDLTFERGNAATVRLVTVDKNRIALDVT